MLLPVGLNGANLGGRLLVSCVCCVWNHDAWHHTSLRHRHRPRVAWAPRLCAATRRQRWVRGEEVSAWMGHLHNPSSWRYSNGVFEYSAMALLYASWPFSSARTTSRLFRGRVPVTLTRALVGVGFEKPPSPRVPPRKPTHDETRRSNAWTLLPNASTRAAHMDTELMSHVVRSVCDLEGYARGVANGRRAEK